MYQQKNNWLLCCARAKGKEMKIKEGLATTPGFLKQKNHMLAPNVNNCTTRSAHGKDAWKKEATIIK